jgi:hypothetical protein
MRVAVRREICVDQACQENTPSNEARFSVTANSFDTETFSLTVELVSLDLTLGKAQEVNVTSNAPTYFSVGSCVSLEPDWATGPHLTPA